MSIRHVQLFHPYSRSRAMESVDAPGRYVADRYGGRGHFGLGVVFEAINRTGFMLDTAHLAGAISFRGAHGTHGCDVPTNVQQFSLDTTSNHPWQIETPYRSVAESAWRPLETIRFGFRADCGPALLLDTDIQEIRGQFTVTADPLYNEGHFASPEANFSSGSRRGPSGSAPSRRDDGLRRRGPLDPTLRGRGGVRLAGRALRVGHRGSAHGATGDGPRRRGACG
nr:hypothetical protein [Deltaproteobacteria bacterium]